MYNISYINCLFICKTNPYKQKKNLQKQRVFYHNTHRLVKESLNYFFVVVWLNCIEENVHRRNNFQQIAWFDHAPFQTEPKPWAPFFSYSNSSLSDEQIDKLKKYKQQWTRGSKDMRYIQSEIAVWNLGCLQHCTSFFQGSFLRSGFLRRNCFRFNHRMISGLTFA